MHPTLDALAATLDAAMAERADCVMLNTGPHVLEAVGVLDDGLRCRRGHQRDEAPRLRRIGAWSAPGSCALAGRAGGRRRGRPVARA